MRTPTAILLAFAMASAGFVAARLIYSPIPDEAAGEGTGEGNCTAPPPGFVESTSVALPVLELPDSRTPALTERPPEPVAPITSAEQKQPTATIDPSDPRTLPEGTLAEMKVKREAIENYMLERTTPLLMQRLADGLSEKVADGDSWSNPDYEQMRTTIYAVQSGGGIPGSYRAVLPRDQYPELYVYKDEVYRLDNAVRAREIAEAKAQWEADRAARR